jgi:murein DD-endopeptidase MepM/ murein hydrolase activator NlpD
VRLRIFLSTAMAIAMVVAMAIVILAQPVAARADDVGTKRTRTRAAQAQVQGQLSLALASDAAVEAQVNRLTAAVATQQNQLGDAQRGETAAAAQLATANRWLADVTGRLDQTRRQLREVAVRSYMRPPQPLAAGWDVNAVARATALLSVAAASQVDAIDANRQAQRDRRQAQAERKGALDTAAGRAKVAADRAAQLSATQRAQQNVHAELQKRIDELRTESRLLAAQESSIEALIQEAAARAAPTQAGQPAGSGGFINGPGSASGLIWPIHAPVTSEFGPRWGGFHPGIDIAGPFGTPIHASKDGVVIFAGPNGGYGNFVLIDHGGGMVTGYAHQSRLVATQGERVSQGQIIGYEGSTGASTGPHLHFEVRINGSTQNPRAFEAGSP